MTAFLTSRALRRRRAVVGESRLDLSDVRRALLSARDPADDISAHGAALLGWTRKRQSELADLSELLVFATRVLQPLRIRGIERHLRRDAVDSEILSEFLSYSRESAQTRIADAADADELAEALIDALDELHAYVLGHELVERGYVIAERASARAILGIGGDEPNGDDQDDKDPLNVSVSGDGAADGDLALAA